MTSNISIKLQELLVPKYDITDKDFIAMIDIIATELERAYRKVDRFEVIDDTGRAYVKGSIYGSPVKVTLSLQDSNRTLKVFVTETNPTNHRKEE